jgi:hypothetical protein
VFYKVSLFGNHAGASLPAAVLASIQAHRASLYIARVGDGDHHILFGNHIFNVYFRRPSDNLRPPRVPVSLFNFPQFFDNNLHDQRFVAQDLSVPLDLFEQLLVFFQNFVLFQRSEPVKAHIQYRLGLPPGQLERGYELLLRLSRAC